MRTREKLEGHAWLFSHSRDQRAGVPDGIGEECPTFRGCMHWLLTEAKLMIVCEQVAEGYLLQCLPSALTQRKIGRHFAACYGGGLYTELARAAWQDYMLCSTKVAEPVLRGSRWVRWVV